MTKPFAEKSYEVFDHIDPSKPVHVYKNLHKGCFSVRQGGIVKCHAKSVYLENAKFVVSEKGRQRVIKEQRKNVHAYVKGTVADPKEINRKIRLDFHWTKCYYDPYRDEKFTDEFDQHVESAQYVDLYHGDPILVFSQMYGK